MEAHSAPEQSVTNEVNVGTWSSLWDTKERRAILRDVVPVFLITHTCIFLVALTGYYFFGRDLEPGHYLWMGVTPSGSTFLRVWERWDSLHYISILHHGYSYFRPGILNTAFFPLYPLLGFLLNTILQNSTISLLLISNTAAFVGLVFVYKLAVLEYGEDVARRSVFYLSIYPFAFVFSGIYTESLFLMNLAATLYYARRQRWGTAAVWGALTTATRLVGVTLIPALLWEYMSQRNWEWKRIDGKSFAIAGMTAGLIGYMIYTYVVFGDFFSFVHSSTMGWNRHAEWPWVAWENPVRLIVQDNDRPMLFFTAIFTAVGIGLVILAFRRMRPMYLILAALLIIIPMSSNQVGGIPRYLLTNIPIFLLLAKLGDNRVIHMGTTVLFLLYLALFTALHANWYWVG